MRGINVAERATKPDEFVNLRAELFWQLREMFERAEVDIDADDVDLAGDLAAMRWFPDSRGRIQIESKEDMIKRGVESPDKAEAIMLAKSPGVDVWENL